MRLRWLSVRDYRNIAHLELTLDEGVNVVSGGNAEGKTNFLESIWMLTGAKSFRTARDAELIRRGADFILAHVLSGWRQLTERMVLSI